jgi:hypothetical protein
MRLRTHRQSLLRLPLRLHRRPCRPATAASRRAISVRLEISLVSASRAGWADQAVDEQAASSVAFSPEWPSSFWRSPSSFSGTGASCESS